jgi:hypothetical protein
MNCDQPNGRMPAPCIIETGIIVNKPDIRRLLADLGRVYYVHIQDGQLQSEGEGYVMEVFADPHHATLVANHSLYLNIYSFDYLELKKSADRQSYFELIQDSRILRLIPLSNPLQEQQTPQLNAAALEAVLAEVLCAKLDAEIDDEGILPF